MRYAKGFIGALAIGLIVYVIGSIVVLAVGDDSISEFYGHYMGLIWMAISVLVFPIIVRRIE